MIGENERHYLWEEEEQEESLPGQRRTHIG